MQNITVLMELPAPPDGWNYTGEFRIPEKGESYFTARTVHSRRMVSIGNVTNRQFILTKEN